MSTTYSWYYYGDGTDHVLYLPDKGVRIANKARFYESEGSSDGLYLRSNLTQKELDLYNEIAEIMNGYHKLVGDVAWINTDVDVLRPAM